MEEDNKSSISRASLKSDGGKAKDKHCFAFDTKKNVNCTGKKYSGTSYSAHKKTSNHNKDTKEFTSCEKDCQTCLKFEGKFVTHTARSSGIPLVVLALSARSSGIPLVVLALSARSSGIIRS
jgi:hypothetical protein